jgi:hypothetical protein
MRRKAQGPPPRREASTDVATNPLAPGATGEFTHALTEWEAALTAQLHPAAPHHLPAFITAPGETDTLMIAVGVLLIVAILAIGNIFLRLHTLPERMAHKSQKLQFEIVAVLGLLALFTHIHLFWVAGLLLALIDLPDFGTPLRRIAGSVEKIAGTRTDENGQEVRAEASAEAAASSPAAGKPIPQEQANA